MSLNTHVGRTVMFVPGGPLLFEIWLKPPEKVNAGSAFVPAAFGTWGNLSTKARFSEPYPSLRFRYPKVAWLVRVEENVCSQLKRAIGEFCGLVGDSMAIATGSEVAVLKPVNWRHQKK